MSRSQGKETKIDIPPLTNYILGRILKVGDFVADVKRAALKNALYDGAVKALGGKENLQSEVEVVENFYLAKDGLHFVYNEYEIACYAAGPVEVVIDPKSL